MRTKRHVLRYVAPGTRNHQRIPVSRRQLELIAALRQAPATRMELLQRDRPRLALNAASTVCGLRSKGVAIRAEWERADDPDGSRCRFVRYSLEGRVLGIEGA